MNAFILLLSFLCFSTGFSGFVLSILLFFKYRNRILFLYAVFIGFWSLNLFAIRILDIFLLQFWNIQEADSLISPILAHFSWGIFTFFLIFMVSKILTQPLKKGVLTGVVFASLFLMVPFELGLFSFIPAAVSGILQYGQIAVHFAVLYYTAFLLKKIVSTLTHKKVRTMYSRLVMLLFILYPLLLLDLIPLTLSRFPFGLGIYPLFYFLVNLFFLRFLSNFIYFPKLDRTVQKDSDGNLYSLTKREQQIASLLVSGRSYKQISDELFIAQETVKTHVSNIYSKVQVTNKIELIKALQKQ